MCDVGDLMLDPEFVSFRKPESQWALMDAKKRNAHFMRFLKKLKPAHPGTSLTTDGSRAITAPPRNSGKKPSQKTGKRANRTRTVRNAKRRLVE